jgi:hypothetical protein
VPVTKPRWKVKTGLGSSVRKLSPKGTSEFYDVSFRVHTETDHLTADDSLPKKGTR